MWCLKCANCPKRLARTGPFFDANNAQIDRDTSQKLLLWCLRRVNWLRHIEQLFLSCWGYTHYLRHFANLFLCCLDGMRTLSKIYCTSCQNGLRCACLPCAYCCNRHAVVTARQAVFSGANTPCGLNWWNHHSMAFSPGFFTFECVCANICLYGFNVQAKNHIEEKLANRNPHFGPKCRSEFAARS